MGVMIQIYRDAENGTFVLRNLDETGAVITTLPQIRLTLADLDYADQVGAAAIEAIFRRVHYVDLAGAKKRCYGLLTIPEDDSADDGHSSATEDLYLGGGGAGETLYTLVAFHFNYLVCAPDGGGSNIVVALEPQLCDTITSQQIGAEQWDYDNHDESDQSRDATCGATTEHQYITPRFLVGDRIPVRACTNTGLSADGTSGLHILTVEVGFPGTGYVVNDVLDVLGGAGEPATLTVTAVDGNGGITGLDIATAGEYTTAPPFSADLAPHSTGGGVGINATITLTISESCQYIALTGRQWAKEHEEPVS